MVERKGYQACTASISKPIGKIYLKNSFALCEILQIDIVSVVLPIMSHSKRASFNM